MSFWPECCVVIRLAAWRKVHGTSEKITLAEVRKTIKQRNHVDSTRKFSPLRISKGAVIVDTTKINKKQMFRKITKVVEEKLFLKYGRNYKAR